MTILEVYIWTFQFSSPEGIESLEYIKVPVLCIKLKVNYLFLFIEIFPKK
jgi:hypothetical protein